MTPCSFRSTLVTALAVVAAFATVISAHAQSDDPRAVLDKGVKASGLTGADVPAWHLKANYTLYDPVKGSVTESGVFEEWHTGPFAWHRVYSEKKLFASEWSTDHIKQFKAKDGKLDLGKLDQQVGRPLVNPAFQAANYKPSVEMSLQAGTFSGLVLDCVVAANPSQAAGAINPDLLFPRLCFDVKDSTLRFITTADTITAYSDFKPLGSRSIANKVEVKPYNRLGAALDITLLEPLSATDQAQVTPPGNAIALPYAHQPGDAPLVPVRITECAYPMDARNNQEHGAVMIPVVIRKDGSVKSNGMPMGPEHLAMSAGDCVGNYKFEPFKIDGEPVDVSDMLIYTFDNRPFTPSMVGIASEAPPPPAAPAKK
jgi:Gram-negative bacterial TonB protein C-terminal